MTSISISGVSGGEIIGVGTLGTGNVVGREVHIAGGVHVSTGAAQGAPDKYARRRRPRRSGTAMMAAPAANSALYLLLLFSAVDLLPRNAVLLVPTWSPAACAPSL